MKNRKTRMMEYDAKYRDIPKDYIERLQWMYDTYHITPSKAEEILRARDQMLSQMEYATYKVVLYEEPYGAERPRAKYLNRSNLIQEAKANPSFIHIYSPHARENNVYMKRLMEDNEYYQLEQLICTPCRVIVTSYFKTPAQYSSVLKFLAEVGLERPLVKPDWDNLGKSYSDMYNANVWLDDALVVEGTSRKFYSILPRVEIDLYYLNMVYNKYQYNNIINRSDFDSNTMKLNYYGG
jgi:Holliday junction resolvase RusA-like endonuclease